MLISLEEVQVSRPAVVFLGSITCFTIIMGILHDLSERPLLPKEEEVSVVTYDSDTYLP
jgi:hypothetical protein